MKSLSKFVAELDFEYAITYSGFRGELFYQKKEEYRAKIEKLRVAQKSKKLIDTSKLKQLEHEVDVLNSRIINKKGELHHSTTLVNLYNKSDAPLREILQLLQTPFKEQDFWMCSPIYRDAIVFYTKTDEIVSMLHICFSCDSIRDGNGDKYAFDSLMKEQLKMTFLNAGHDVDFHDRKAAERAKRK